MQSWPTLPTETAGWWLFALCCFVISRQFIKQKTKKQKTKNKTKNQTKCTYYTTQNQIILTSKRVWSAKLGILAPRGQDTKDIFVCIVLCCFVCAVLICFVLFCVVFVLFCFVLCCLFVLYCVVLCCFDLCCFGFFDVVDCKESREFIVNSSLCLRSSCFSFFERNKERATISLIFHLPSSIFIIFHLHHLHHLHHLPSSSSIFHLPSSKQIKSSSSWITGEKKAIRKNQEVLGRLRDVGSLLGQVSVTSRLDTHDSH